MENDDIKTLADMNITVPKYTEDEITRGTHNTKNVIEGGILFLTVLAGISIIVSGIGTGLSTIKKERK